MFLSMVGVTSIEVKESLDNLVERLGQAETATAKERLQVLYWLKQENPPTVSAIAKALGKHRNTVQTWLLKYRNGGVDEMLLPQALARRSTGNSAMGRRGVGKAIRGAASRV
ncbi:helix-turn-helix domain-containing protein [Nostoc flagelliforme FACHB-838]|uniref:Helix-turn-helix domain-containing protein n=1 Tax=Nostoc flagelliforme FACHB-838 TaxID=2692904 RepID=A0ABR8DS81_9NOSO|nr:helix-turn-helix domain-containing protein [Nostoc flagelliforme]MBD2531761.1 helix-turn-helix domain-containing protein [Nostoc flagelliforme FACHB-838]